MRGRDILRQASVRGKTSEQLTDENWPSKDRLRWVLQLDGAEDCRHIEPTFDVEDSFFWDTSSVRTVQPRDRTLIEHRSRDDECLRVASEEPESATIQLAQPEFTQIPVDAPLPRGVVSSKRIHNNATAAHSSVATVLFSLFSA